jgi:archaellum biogenesis ATPase FlaH
MQPPHLFPTQISQGTDLPLWPTPTTHRTLDLSGGANRFCISSGCPQLDHLIQGGLKSGELTEISGVEQTGKTTLCHQFLVSSQLMCNTTGGVIRSIYIDAEGRFAMDKIVSICQRFNLSPDAVMGNIETHQAETTTKLDEILLNISQKLTNSPGYYGLLVLNDTFAIYRRDIGELEAKALHIISFFKTLKQMAEEHNIAILIAKRAGSTTARRLLASKNFRYFTGDIGSMSVAVRLFLNISMFGRMELYMCGRTRIGPAYCIIRSDGVHDADRVLPLQWLCARWMYLDGLWEEETGFLPHIRACLPTDLVFECNTAISAALPTLRPLKLNKLSSNTQNNNNNNNNNNNSLESPTSTSTSISISTSSSSSSSSISMPTSAPASLPDIAASSTLLPLSSTITTTYTNTDNKNSNNNNNQDSYSGNSSSSPVTRNATSAMVLSSGHCPLLTEETGSSATVNMSGEGGNGGSPGSTPLPTTTIPTQKRLSLV